jgi:hypothetical protein
MTETWKDIKGTDYYYQISNYGRVRSCRGLGQYHKRLDSWRVLKPRIVCGYHSYHLCITNVDGKSMVRDIRAHRCMWETFIGTIPLGYCIDHIDRNRTNNCLSNLRIVTFSNNVRNSDKYHRKGAFKTSKYVGVHYNKRDKTWVARLWVKNKLLYIGTSKSEEEAAELWNKAAVKYFKEFANINIM